MHQNDIMRHSSLSCVPCWGRFSTHLLLSSPLLFPCKGVVCCLWSGSSFITLSLLSALRERPEQPPNKTHALVDDMHVRAWADGLTYNCFSMDKHTTGTCFVVCCLDDSNPKEMYLSGERAGASIMTGPATQKGEGGISVSLHHGACHDCGMEDVRCAGGGVRVGVIGLAGSIDSVPNFSGELSPLCPELSAGGYKPDLRLGGLGIGEH